MLPKARICEHLDPRAAAAEKAGTFAGTPWAGLHAELTALFGPDAVGIFGSAMLGMHLTPDGQVRKDVDFVIEGTGNIPVLREHLPAIRSRLGFTEVTSARQGRQYERYRRVFRNENNSTDLVISRRWTALQAPNGIVTTIRFRDPAVRTALPAGRRLPRPGQGHHRDRAGRRRGPGKPVPPRVPPAHRRLRLYRPPVVVEVRQPRPRR